MSLVKRLRRVGCKYLCTSVAKLHHFCDIRENLDR